MDGYLRGTQKYWQCSYGTCVPRGMYGDNCGIFAGKARPAPHLIQPCPEWCVHTSLLIQPQLHRAVNSLRFTAHLGRVLLVHMKPLSPARNIHRKISALMGKSIAYQSTIAIEVTECKCVNATLHRKRDFILLPNALSKVESYYAVSCLQRQFHHLYSTSFYSANHKIAQIWQGFHLCVKQMLLLF